MYAICNGKMTEFLTFVGERNPKERSHLEMRSSHFDVMSSGEEVSKFIQKAKQAHFSFKECNIDTKDLIVVQLLTGRSFLKFKI